MNTALANTKPSQLENVLINGDLSKLQPDERVMYYKAVCESVGLNPLTKPFEYITLNGKLTLYARRDATDQLRNIHKVSITIVARETVEDCYVVTARAITPHRQDESIGAVNIQGLKGEARANAMMKAETKAKRRVTLSVCGLGMLDELEVETVAPLKATSGFLQMQPVKRQEVIIDVADQIKGLLANDQIMDAYAMWQDSKLDVEETIALMSLLDSKQRGVLGRLHEAEQAREGGTISPAQKKRLEARIGELKGLVERDTIKAICKSEFGKEHFADLTMDEYKDLDARLDVIASTSSATPPRSSSESPLPPLASDGAAGDGTPTIYDKLIEARKNASVTVRGRFDIKMKAYASVSDMPLETATNALKWINQEIDKEAV